MNPPAAPAAPPAAPTPPPPAAPPAPAPAAPPPPQGQAAADEFKAFSAELESKWDKDEGTPPPPAPGKKGADPEGGTPPPDPAAGKKIPLERMPKEFREEYNQLKSEVKAKTDAVAALEAKIKDFDARGKDTEALTTRLKALESELEAASVELRSSRLEADPQFKKKYDEPFNQLAGKAQSVISRLEVVDEAGTPRKAAWGDFERIYQMDEAEAEAAAVTMFGEIGSRTAMHYYRSLHEINDRRQAELDDYRKNYKDREAEQIARNEAQRRQLTEIFEKATKELSDTNADYRDDPTDTELADARKRGFELIDKMPPTIEQRVVKDAHIRHMAAAFWPMKIVIQRQKQEIAKLKAEVEGKTRIPGRQTRQAAPGAGPEKDWEDEARETLSNVQ